MAEEPTQRQVVVPSLVVSAPEDYPAPSPGQATRWALVTPAKEPVGDLVFNPGGLDWTPADTEDELAQASAAEVLEFLRGNRAQETPVEDVLAAIQSAYVGDLTETSEDYAPEASPTE